MENRIVKDYITERATDTTHRNNYNYKIRFFNQYLVADYQTIARSPFIVNKKLRVCRQGVNSLSTNS
ncbi:MAG: hypothetical protein EGR83_15595 [Bacteroides cellulosilyticus]|nr:hypothetical protein [Bacteroides cellulosilyticus]